MPAHHHKSSQSTAMQTTQESTVRLRGTGRSTNDKIKEGSQAILVSCASGATLTPSEGNTFASITLSNHAMNPQDQQKATQQTHYQQSWDHEQKTPTLNKVASPTRVECKALTANKEVTKCNNEDIASLVKDEFDLNQHETLSVNDAEVSDGAKLLFSN